MTDSKFILDDEYISQNDIVQRYLQNKLTPEETVMFEEYMMDKPELLEQLELDSVMVGILPQVKNQTEKSKLTESKNSLGWLIGVIRSPNLAWSLCAAFFGLMLLNLNHIGENQVSDISPEIVYLEIVRGKRDVQEIKLEKSRNPQILALEIGAKPRKYYKVKIINLANHKVLESLSIQSNNIGLLVLSFGESLGGGEYSVSAKPSNTEMYTEYFHLKVN